MATTGAQESIARTLFLESQYTLNNVYSFRFQPMLSESMNAELDNSNTTFLTYLHDTAIEYFNDNIDDVTTFIGHLTA